MAGLGTAMPCGWLASGPARPGDEASTRVSAVRLARVLFQGAASIKEMMYSAVDNRSFASQYGVDAVQPAAKPTIRLRRGYRLSPKSAGKRGFCRVARRCPLAAAPMRKRFCGPVRARRVRRSPPFSSGNTLTRGSFPVAKPPARGNPHFVCRGIPYACRSFL